MPNCGQLLLRRFRASIFPLLPCSGGFFLLSLLWRFFVLNASPDLLSFPGSLEHDLLIPFTIHLVPWPLWLRSFVWRLLKSLDILVTVEVSLVTITSWGGLGRFPFKHVIWALVWNSWCFEPFSMFSKNYSFELEGVVLSKTFVALWVIFRQAFPLRLLLSPSFPMKLFFRKRSSEPWVWIYHISL